MEEEDQPNADGQDKSNHLNDMAEQLNQFDFAEIKESSKINLSNSTH